MDRDMILKRHPRVSIVTRIFILLSIMLLLVAGGELINGLNLRQNRLRELHSETLQLARIAELDMVRILDGTHQLLATLARLPVGHGWDQRACSVLEATAGADFEYDHFAAVDLDGVIRCSSNGAQRIGRMMVDRDFVARTLASGNDFAVGAYGKAQVSGNDVLRVGHLVVDGQGKTVGAIFTGINLTWLNTALSQWNLGKNVRIDITDRNGILVASYPNSRSVGRAISEDLKPHLSATAIGSAEKADGKGAHNLYGFIPVSVGLSSALGVFVGRDVTAAIAEINRSIWLNIAAVLVGLIVSGILAASYIRNIVARPFQDLLLAAGRWRVGDWSARAGTASGISEFERLAVAFDGMAEEVAARDLSLQRRDVILNAIAKCAAHFVTAFTLAEAIPTILRTMGEAIDADRVLVLEAESTGPPVILRYSWQAVAAPGEVGAGYFALLPTAVPPEISEWLKPHLEGGIVMVTRSKVRGAVKEVFDAFKIESNLQAPILVDGTLFGLISIDDCRTERVWTPIEIEAVSVLANLIGAAIARERHLEKMSNADAVVSNSPAIVYRMAADVSPPRVTFVSDNISFLGNNPAKLAADSGVFFACVHPDDREAFEAAIATATAGSGAAGSVEYRIVNEDGTFRWVENRYKPMHDVAGRLKEIVGVVVEVTERKAAEEKLQFANTLFSTLTETMPDGIVVVDADKQIISLNRRFVEIWRLPSVLLETKDDVAVLAAVTSLVKNPDAFAARVRYIYEHIWESARDEVETLEGRFLDRRTAALRADDGRYLGRVWFFRDVTLEKQAFEIAQATLERAQRQLQMVGLVSKADALISGDVDGLARQITRQAAGVMGCERVAVWLFDDDETELRCIDLYEASSETHSAGMVMREQEYRNELRLLKDTLYIAADDPLNDPRTVGYVETYLKPLRITSMLDAVIESGGRNLGLICFEHVDNPHRWKQDEIAFARQLADKVGQGVLTRQRRIEDERRRCSEAALAEAQQIARMGSWSFDAVSNAASYSAETYRMLGVDPATLGPTYEAYLSRIHPDDRASFDRAFANGVTSHKGYVVEYRMLMDDGSIKWIHDIGRNYYDADGRHLRTAGTMQDITERKKAEAALVDSELRFRTILDTAADGIVVVDVQTRKIVQGNHAFAVMLGRDEVVGLGEEDIFPAESLPEARRLMLQVRLGEIKLMAGVPIMRKDGSVFYAEISGAAITLGGRPHLAGIFHDVSQRRNAALALRQERDFADAVIDSLPGLFLLIDEKSHIVRSNDNLSLLTGIAGAQLQGSDAISLVVEGDREVAREKLAEAFTQGIVEIELDVLAKGGEVRTIDLSGRTISRDGHPFLIGIGSDMTEARRAESRLRASEERFRAVSGAALDAIILVDHDGRVMFWNKAAERILGYTADEAIGRGIHEWLAPERYREKAIIAMRSFAETGRGDILGRTLELAALRKDGVEIDIELSVASMRLGEDWHAVAVLRDITERKRIEAQMVRMARYDILTGLANRAVFVEAVEHEISRVHRDGTSFAVLYLDLDHFKDVNDILGHPVGDLLLQAVADRLQNAVREMDTIARFGGDEFAMIATDLEDPADAATLADKVLKVISEPFLLQGSEIRSGASVGIAVYGPESPDAELLLSHADVALYRAKTEGRGTYRFFTDAMDSEVRMRVALGSELRSAIASEQLFLLYQPQVDINTGYIIGVEALVRWRHPTRGVLSPDEFIHIAETSGMIVALGNWVLRDACRQMKEWLNAGIAPALIAVNLSALQFKTPHELQKGLDAILAETGVPPQRIELELTESVMMDASQRYGEVLAWLRHRGFRIAIDDFGTGYSSLDYLRRFPVDRIKIAQQFMLDPTNASGNAAIVKAAVALARALKIGLIMEGVETAEHLALVKLLGVRDVQGYYFSKPVSEADITALLQRGTISPGTIPPTSPANILKAARHHEGRREPDRQGRR